MKNQAGNFDADLSNMYDALTEADYYSMFFDSIFHYLNAGDIQAKTVLDIGCGNGKLCQRFMTEGAATAMGLDISEDQVAIAQKINPSEAYAFQVADAYAPFDLGRTFGLVSCIYALHFTPDFATLKTACENIYRHLEAGGVAVVLDITHDYVYNKALMQQLKQLTMYEYLPEVPEGSIPEAWQSVKGRVHTENGILKIDHIAIHGTNLIQALQAVGFSQVERKPFVHPNQTYVDLWGPAGFNHHLLFCRK